MSLLFLFHGVGQQTLQQGHVTDHGVNLRTQGRLQQGHIADHGRDLTQPGRLTAAHVTVHGRNLQQTNHLEKGHVNVHGRDLRRLIFEVGHLRARARGLLWTPPGAPEWGLRITARNGSAIGSFASDGAADDWPVLAFDFQDPCADIGVGHLAVPAEHDANDLLTEDNLIHYFARGVYVCTLVAREPDVAVVQDPGNRRIATYRLETSNSVLAEGIIEPPGVEGTRPVGADRIFDSSDPARDNSDFETPEVLGSVTDAQTNYTVTPYGDGMLFPGDVQVLGPPGYGWGDDAPGGRCYFYRDFDFPPGFYVSNQVADNGWEARSNGVSTVPFTIGFGNAAQVTKRFYSGVVRLWAVVENGGSESGQGPCTYAAEWVAVDAADQPAGSPTVVTDSDWQVMAFPANPPGFTPGEIGLLVLAEEQAQGVWSGDFTIEPTFTATHTSDGMPWPDTWDISAKSGQPAEDFWLKKMATYCDVDTSFDFVAGRILWHLYSKGGNRQPSGVTLTEGTNLGELEIAAAPTAASEFLTQWNDGGDLQFRTVAQTPAAGHPVRRRSLALGADHSSAEVDRDGDGQLDLFNRQQAKPTIAHVTSSATPDTEFPGVAYWKWSILTLAITSRWLSAGSLEPIAMTVHLDAGGNMQATPESGDLIVPPMARANVILRRMAGPSVAGRSRVSSPVHRV